MVNFKKTMMASAGGGEDYWVMRIYDASDSSNNWTNGAVDIDADGNVYFGAFSADFGYTATGSIVLIKFDQSGSAVWSKSIIPPYASDTSILTYAYYPNFLGLSGSDIYILSNVNANYYGYKLFKVNQSNGSISSELAHTNATNYPTNFGAGHVDSSGNVYGSGQVYPAAPSNYREGPLFVKNNSSLAYQWGRSTRVSASYNDSNLAITTDSSGNVYGLGKEGDTFNPTLVKYNSSGVVQFEKSWTLGTDRALNRGTVRVDASGNIYLNFSRQDDTSLDYFVYVIKLNSSGVIQWQKEFVDLNNSANTMHGGMDLDSSGNVYVNIGQTRAGLASGVTPNAALVKLNNSGGVEWQTQWENTNANGSYSEYTHSFKVSPSGVPHIYLRSNSASYGTVANLAKVPEDGSGLGSYTYFDYKAGGLTIRNSSWSEDTSYDPDNYSLSLSTVSRTSGEATISPTYVKNDM